MPPNQGQNANQAGSNAANFSSMFAGAPFSKVVAAFTVIAYISMHTGNSNKYNSTGTTMFDFDATRIRERGETFRLFTSKMTFGSTSDLFVGTMFLTFLMRKFEREMGTRKMTFFCSFINLATIATETLIVARSSSSILSHNLHYSGPYPLMGALFSLYHRYTPRLHPRFFSILGIHFSEKIFHYAWLAQIVLSHGWNSAYGIGIGCCFSLCYEFLPFLGKFDVPDSVAHFVGSLSSRFLDPPPRILAPHSANNAREGRGGAGGGQRIHPHAAAVAAAAAAGGGGGAGRRPTAVAQRPQPVTPDPAAIEQLTHMGFSRPEVVEALKNTNNDVHRAAERLLMQQGSQ